MDVANIAEKDNKRSITSIGHVTVDIQVLMSILRVIS